MVRSWRAVMAVLAGVEAVEHDFPDAYRNFWELRVNSYRAETYFFALILRPRLTLLYMFMYDTFAVPALLNEPSALSVMLFGSFVPHLFAAYNFYGAFASANWLTSLAFLIASLKGWVRDIALFTSLLGPLVLYWGFSVQQNPQARRDASLLLCQNLFEPVLKTLAWVVGYGVVYNMLLRPLLPQMMQDAVFVFLAADVAGFHPIKSLVSAREAAYARARTAVFGVTRAEEGGDPGPRADSAHAGQGPNMKFFSFSSGGGFGGASFQAGNINAEEVFRQMQSNMRTAAGNNNRRPLTVQHDPEKEH